MLYDEYDFKMQGDYVDMATNELMLKDKYYNHAKNIREFILSFY
jgi:hypothetical protein